MNRDAEESGLRALVCCLLAAATLAVYWPVTRFGFVFDDGQYLLQNPIVLRGLSAEGAAWALRAFYAENWHPLTWLSHMADVSIFGADPGRHHLVSLLWHVGNAVVLFLLLDRLTGRLWRSALVAGLFALHPLHVESVAWVAERKDVLSTFFWLWTIWAYSRYARRPGGRRLLATALCFALALAAKPMPVTLPFLLLLLDYWPLERLNRVRDLPRLLLEKVPLALLAAISAVLTLKAQAGGGAVKSLEVFGLGTRIANALVAYVKYAAAALWPSGLAVFYPHPGDGLPAWQGPAAAVALAVLSALVLRAAPRARYLATGWFWFLGTLVPVIGLVQVGSQALADRYTYVPLIGLFLVLVWGGADLAARRRPPPWAGPAAALALLLPLALAARAQVGYWQSEESLYQRALRVTTGNYLAHSNLATALARQGRLDEAAPHYEEALRLRPGYLEPQVGVAVILAARGRLAEAEALYRKVLRQRPDYALAHGNLGVVLARRGAFPEAIAHLAEARRLVPGDPEVLRNLALAQLEAGRVEEALGTARAALREAPASAAAHAALAGILIRTGDAAQAIARYRESLRLDPRNVEAMNNLGSLLLDQGEAAEAAGLFRRALELRPAEPLLRRNLEEAEAAARR